MSTRSPSQPHTSTVGSSQRTPWVLDDVLVLRSSTNSRYRGSQKKDRSGTRHDGQDDRKIPLRGKVSTSNRSSLQSSYSVLFIEKASWRSIKALGISSPPPPATAQWRRAKLMLNESLHLHSHSSAMLTVRYDDVCKQVSDL